jgi:hypothetical protein
MISLLTLPLLKSTLEKVFPKNFFQFFCMFGSMHKKMLGTWEIKVRAEKKEG